MGYKKEILSHHVGVRMTPTDGVRLTEVANEHNLDPAPFARKILLDFIDNYLRNKKKKKVQN